MKDRRVNNNESFASDFNMPEPFYLDQTQFDNGNLFSNTNMMLNMQPLIQMAVLNNQHNKEDKKKLNINQNNQSKPKNKKRSKINKNIESDEEDEYMPKNQKDEPAKKKKAKKQKQPIKETRIFDNNTQVQNQFDPIQNMYQPTNYYYNQTSSFQNNQIQRAQDYSNFNNFQGTPHQQYANGGANNYNNYSYQGVKKRQEEMGPAYQQDYYGQPHYNQRYPQPNNYFQDNLKYGQLNSEPPGYIQYGHPDAAKLKSFKQVPLHHTPQSQQIYNSNNQNQFQLQQGFSHQYRQNQRGSEHNSSDQNEKFMYNNPHLQSQPQVQPQAAQNLNFNTNLSNQKRPNQELSNSGSDGQIFYPQPVFSQFANIRNEQYMSNRQISGRNIQKDSSNSNVQTYSDNQQNYHSFQNYKPNNFFSERRLPQKQNLGPIGDNQLTNIYRADPTKRRDIEVFSQTNNYQNTIVSEEQDKKVSNRMVPMQNVMDINHCRQMKVLEEEQSPKNMIARVGNIQRQTSSFRDYYNSRTFGSAKQMSYDNTYQPNVGQQYSMKYVNYGQPPPSRINYYQSQDDEEIFEDDDDDVDIDFQRFNIGL